VSTKPPNVLLILTDDQGWDDLGHHGNPYLQTPRLDALARESVQFGNFYVAAVCAPTRASLLTGRHFLRAGVSHVHGGKDYVHPDERMMPELFRNAGYRTGMWGKWHSGKTTGYLPWERGFDEAYMARLYKHRDSVGRLNGEPREHEGWTVETLTDYAIDFLRRHREEPFFAFVPHMTVHAPLAAPEELAEKYERMGLTPNLALIYAMLDQLDTQVGRLLDSLDELGLAENTIVLFMSDNGPAYNGDLLTDEDRRIRYVNGYKGHKGNMWENGIKSPLFVRFPERFRPHTVERLCDVCDLMPTLLDLCGIDLPTDLPSLDGRSFLPYLEGNEQDLPPKESHIYVDPAWPPHEHRDGEHCEIHAREYDPVASQRKAELNLLKQCVGVRTEAFKLLQNPGWAPGVPYPVEGRVLVDMKADPKEDYNVFAAFPSEADALGRSLEKWFDGIKVEPHSFHTPTFVIGPDATNLVYLCAPVRLHGKVHNATVSAPDWSEPGDAAEYLLHVSRAGQYGIDLECRGAKAGRQMNLRLSVGESELLATIDDGKSSALGAMEFPEGDCVLRVELVSGGPGPKPTPSRLITLSFRCEE
jgi:arylsulfatase A-like enzyme